MCAAYVGAVQLVERQVLLAQFADSALDRDEVWELVWKTKCYQSDEFDWADRGTGAKVRVEFEDGEAVEDKLYQPKGMIRRLRIRILWKSGGSWLAVLLMRRE